VDAVAVFFAAVRALLDAVLAARVFLEAVFAAVRLALGMLDVSVSDPSVE
jgi:hypothetical protein